MKSIKYILTMGLGFVAASVTNAARYDPPESGGPATVMVNQSDVLVAPTATELINANPEFSDFFKVKGWQVNIDTTPSINPIDGYQTQLKTLQINTPYIDLSDILLKKLNRGALYLNGGTAITASISTTDVFSLCATLGANFAGSFAFGNLTFTAASNVLTVSDGVNSTTASLSATETQTMVFIQNSSGSTLYINGEQVATESLTFTAGTFGITGGTGLISRIKIFNIDLSAEGALYTVANYTAGIDEPPALKGAATQTNTDPDLGANTSGGWSGSIGTKGVWTAGSYVSYIYNADLTGDSEAASLGISSAVDFTTKFYGTESSSAIGGFYNNALNLNDFAGKTVSIHYSFYIKRMQNVYTHFGIFAPRNNAVYPARTIAEYSASDLPYNQWVKIEDTVLFDVAYGVSNTLNKIGFGNSKNNIDISAAAFRIANFQLEVRSVAALSLSNYTLNGKVLDTSGSGNDATVSGLLAGDCDAEIGALYKAFTGNAATASFSGYVPTVQAFGDALRAALNSDGTAYTNTYQYEDDITVLTEWTDGEFKVLDENGDLIYWVSTQWGAQMGGDYTTNDATDLNAKIFYTCPENEVNGTGKGREWIEYVHDDVSARTIYEHAQGITGSPTPTIGGIIIQPNFSGTTVGGTSIQSIFGKNALDAPSGYQFIYLKASPTNLEKTKTAYPIWRTIRPIPVQGGN